MNELFILPATHTDLSFGTDKRINFYEQDIIRCEQARHQSLCSADTVGSVTSNKPDHQTSQVLTTFENYLFLVPKFVSTTLLS